MCTVSPRCSQSILVFLLPALIWLQTCTACVETHRFDHDYPLNDEKTATTGLVLREVWRPDTRFNMAGQSLLDPLGFLGREMPPSDLFRGLRPQRERGSWFGVFGLFAGTVSSGEVSLHQRLTAECL